MRFTSSLPQPKKWVSSASRFWKEKHPGRGAASGASSAPPTKKRKFSLGHGKKRWVLLALLIAVAVAVAILSGGRSTDTASSEYTEAQVENRTISSTLTGSGTLQPANSYTVTTLTEGDILTADFEEGDVVEKDSVLYTIDSSDVSNSIQQSQLSLSQAQRNYQDAVDSCSIKAPVAGQIYSLDVKVGDAVTQGQTVATIRQSSTMTLTVPFPADDAKSFYTGQTATVTLNSTFEQLTGTVQSVSGSDIVGTGNVVTRNVKIQVKNPGGLSTTQTATATINGISSAGAGTFDYQVDRTVTADTNGTVTAIHVSEGSTVAKNTVLITLGGDSLENSIQSAQDNVSNAELSLDSAQNQLDNYTITSPIQGTIVDKQYKAGDTVSSGQTLCTIYDLTYLEMNINIDELDIGKVSVGQEVTITADAVEGQTFTGVITKVSLVSSASSSGTTAAASSTGATSYPVTVRIDEIGDLRPGMNVDASIQLDSADNALAIPSQAITRDNLVLVTQDSPSAANAADKTAPEGYVYVEVTTGISDDNYTQILTGLQSGDTVAYQAQSAESDTSAEDMMMPGGGMDAGGGGGMQPSGGGGGGFPG